MTIKMALKHLLSKPVLAICTLIAVSGALSILGVFWTLVENMNRVRVTAIATPSPDSSAPVRPGLTLFVDPTLPAAESEKLQAKLKGDVHFSALKVVSTEDALKSLEAEFGETLGKVFTGDTLPVTYRLEFAMNGTQPTFSREELNSLLNTLRSMPGVLDVEEGNRLGQFNQASQGNRIFSWATGLLIIVFAIVSLLVSHLIRIAFETLRPEVETLKILGASKFWIFKPLLIEGIFLGFFGALTSLGLLSLLIHLVLPKFSEAILPKGIVIDSLSMESSIRLVGLSVVASLMGALFTWPLVQKAPTQA